MQMWHLAPQGVTRGMMAVAPRHMWGHVPLSERKPEVGEETPRLGCENGEAADRAAAGSRSKEKVVRFREMHFRALGCLLNLFPSV